MQHYNPFSAAIAQLHTPEAIAYYKLRSQQDAETLLIATVQAGCAIYEAAVFAYNLGVFCRAWMFALEQAATPAPECTAIVPVQTTSIVEESEADEIIEGEIVEEPITYLLAPAATVATIAQTTVNEQFVLNVIAPSAAALSLIKSIEKTDRRLEEMSKVAPKRTRKPKTETKAKPAPKGRKAAGIAPQPAPLTVRGVPIN